MTPNASHTAVSHVQRWVLTAPGRPMTPESVPALPLSAGQVRVRVAGCGVCRTDVDYAFGAAQTNHSLPLTLGHEISGTVVEATRGSTHLLGKAVVVPAVIPCTTCSLCTAERGAACSRQTMPGNDQDGGFAEYVTVPGWPLAVVEDFAGDVHAPLGAAGVSLAELSVVADAVSTPFQAIEQADLAPGDFAVFFGVGSVGGFGAQIAQARGAAVVAVDVREERLERMRSCGIDRTLNAAGLDARAVGERLTELAHQAGARPEEWKLFETSGTVAGQEFAFQCLTHQATLSVIGLTREPARLRLSRLAPLRARVLGSWGCDPRHYPAALRLVLEGKVRIGPFIKQYPLAEINAVFDEVHHHAVSHRPVLVPNP
jgi:6-hydroxycyclohex-1-ene-1-carbonyl-CoA dehydrogenase